MANMNGTESEKNGMNGLVFDENGNLDMVASAPVLKSSIGCAVVSVNVPEEFMKSEKRVPVASINDLFMEDLAESADHLDVAFDSVE
jgi:hypothetical protein